MESGAVTGNSIGFFVSVAKNVQNEIRNNYTLSSQLKIIFRIGFIPKFPIFMKMNAMI